MKDLIFYPVIGVIMLASGAEVLDALRPQHISMTAVALEYEDGRFFQEHRVTGADRLRAEWAARITRGDEYLCGGGGAGTYANGGSARMTPTVWAGSECPELQAGDVAEATWEYVDENNVRHRISATIEIDTP